MREDARRIIRNAVGGTGGSAATAAVNKLVGILELRRADSYPQAVRAVVFVGPYEHHSNELPWRESVADVMVIDEDADGHIDLGELEAQLVRYAGRPLRIGSFSAASNVTGILTDTDRVARLLHAHGALPFWDCAAVRPRVAERPPGAGDQKDALFFSPAQVRRRSADPEHARRPPRTGPQPSAHRAGRRPRRSWSPFAPGWSSPSNGPSAPTPSRPPTSGTEDACSHSGTATPASRSSATSMPGGCPSSPSASTAR
ncbi:aminotransferase class V-fold PLP-dependent enzyme [Streptomyces mirabilis]|uniref:aminotransferase class V-fold PLP-dependent enzyme n=1 Tax=Streptomyces mirabilis TaxID=68239 RepID=UPI0034E94391